MKIFILLTVLILQFHASAAQHEAFGRLPLLDDAQISPDGKRIAYLRDVKNKYYLVTQELNNPASKPKMFGVGEGKIRSFQWANNQFLLFESSIPFYSRGDYETFTMWRLGILNSENNEAKWPFRSNKFEVNIGAATLVNILPKDPDHILLSHYYTSLIGNKMTEVFKVNLKTAEHEGVFRRKYSQDYFASDSGDILLFLMLDAETDEYLWNYRMSTNDEFVLIKDETNDEHGYFDGNILGIDGSTGAIYFYQRNQESFLTLVKADVVDGKVINRKTIASPDGLDVSDVVLNTQGSSVIGYRYIDDYV